MTAQHAEIQHGIVQSFSAGTWTATVQLLSSTLTYLAGVRVARNIASGEMTAGRRCAIAFFDAANPQDAVVFAVWA
jgi:hypothetical protein